MTFFIRGPGARNWSYTAVKHSTFKTYPNISNSGFYPNLNFLNFKQQEK